jgi:2',3'-cyclic-nucleotide 2'-phosphodiesterase/3'-nucleotidase
MRDMPCGVGQADMAAMGASPVLSLRILATSDLHAHVLAWDYHVDQTHHGVGLARTASLIKQARECATNSMLLDNGDFLNGSQLGEHATGQLIRPATVHPMIKAMNTLCYDAANLGNHEFSHGVEWLTQCLQPANFPVISSNLDLPSAAFPKDLMLSRDFKDEDGIYHRLNIGLIGLLPPQTLEWEAKHLAGRANVRDIYQTAKERARILRKKGADIVIALCHSGLGNDKDEFLENQGQRVTSIPEIDAVVMGHTHEVYASGYFNQDANHRAPSVMPGSYGSHLGIIDLSLRKLPHGWQVFRGHSETRAVAERGPKSGLLVPLVNDDPVVSSEVMAEHREIIAANERVVAQSSVPLNSFFALISDTSMGHLLAEAKSHYLSAAVRGTQFEGLPILSAVASFRCGGRGGPENYTNIAAGPINARSIADIYTHSNTIVGLCVTGDALKRWLERSAGLYHQVFPLQEDAPLIDTKFPSFNFDVIYGVSYQIHLNSPAMFDWQDRLVDPQANRIKSLTYQGAIIEPQDKFLLATNSYRFATISKLLGTTGVDVVSTPPQTGQDIVAHYLRDRAHFNAARTGFWGFAPMPGTSVVFETSPKALMHLPELLDFNLETLEQTSLGFQRFRLHL